MSRGWELCLIFGAMMDPGVWAVVIYLTDRSAYRGALPLSVWGFLFKALHPKLFWVWMALQLRSFVAMAGVLVLLDAGQTPIVAAIGVVLVAIGDWILRDPRVGLMGDLLLLAQLFMF